jgi:hypothetical protein
MENEEATIQNIYKKIEREKALLNAANAMRAQTNNEAVRSRLDSQMRDGRRNLQFFEEKLRELQMRRVNQGMDNMSLGSDMRNNSEGPPAPPPKDASQWRDPASFGSAQLSQQGGQDSNLMPPRHPFAPPQPGSGIPKARPNFTKLGMYPFPNLSH